MILVTANMRDEAKAGQDFLPLMVDFRENTYSAGKIPGGFFKREGKPSEKEVLLSRLIDRPIRPLFAENYHHDTQVIAMLLSADFSVDYDAMGIIGASAALLSSTIPFSTPLGAVKIGWKKTGEYFDQSRPGHSEGTGHGPAGGRHRKRSGHARSRRQRILRPGFHGRAAPGQGSDRHASARRRKS